MARKISKQFHLPVGNFILVAKAASVAEWAFKTMCVSESAGAAIHHPVYANWKWTAIMDPIMH